MVASVPNIQDRERDVRLGALKSDVLSFGAEGETSELESLSATVKISREIW